MTFSLLCVQKSCCCPSNCIARGPACVPMGPPPPPPMPTYLPAAPLQFCSPGAACGAPYQVCSGGSSCQSVRRCYFCDFGARLFSLDCTMLDVCVNFVRCMLLLWAYRRLPTTDANCSFRARVAVHKTTSLKGPRVRPWVLQCRRLHQLIHSIRSPRPLSSTANPEPLVVCRIKCVLEAASAIRLEHCPRVSTSA
jgi:hypothetical protein